jgi:molybdate-binding protein/DNA-binding XRE family transcriptional regulator
MGRRGAAPQLENRVRELRIALGLSQQQLAQQAGLTRQAVNSIERGYYVPNTIVALRLAQVLRSSVEELFVLPPVDTAPEIDVVAHGSGDLHRLAVGCIGEQWVGYPLDAGWDLQAGFPTADVLTGANEAPYWVTPREQLAQTAILLGCDPSLGILSAHLGARSAPARLRWLAAGSQVALDAVAQGRAHLAGTHLPDPDGADYNLRSAQHALTRTGGLVVEFARWELGLAVAAGNPKNIHGVADLARPDVRIVNREAGAGSRALLDAQLMRDGIPSTAVQGYDRSVGSHWAAAAAVSDGGADAAITLRASAISAGVDFLPLELVRFDFVIPTPHVTHPSVAPLLELLQTTALRLEIGALPGYEVAGMGTVHAAVEASAA